jgi:hypothetical protein
LWQIKDETATLPAVDETIAAVPRLEITKPADLKSAGHGAVPSAVQVVAVVLKNTPKRSAMILIAQQHTQNWVDS